MKKRDLGYFCFGILVMLAASGISAFIEGYRYQPDRYDLMREQAKAWEMYQESVVKDYLTSREPNDE